MAMFLDSTTAPVVQTGLLPFVFRPVPPVDDPRSAVELLDEIRSIIEAQEISVQSAPKSELLPEPLLLAFHGDTRTDIGSADRCSLPTNYPDHIGVVGDRPDEIRLANHARTRYLRRQLVEAAEHGVALLAALGLPRLVDADFEPIDREAVADALDVVISHLDAVDAPDEDREPWLAGDYNSLLDLSGEMEAELEHDEDDGLSEPSLGAPENHPGRWSIDMAGHYFSGTRHHPLGDQRHWNAGANSDAEDDGDDREPEAGYDLACDEDELDGAGEVDAELSCGWTAKVDQVHLGQSQDEHETTALERFGKGFFRSGPDDAEDGHDAETVFEDGSEDEPYGWRFQRPNAVQIAARVAEVARHG